MCGSPGPEQQRPEVAQFVELTGATQETAAHLLQTAGYRLEAAVTLFFESTVTTTPPLAPAPQESVTRTRTKQSSSQKKRSAGTKGGDGDLFTMLIHFHHILNDDKREVIQRWAWELELGGHSRTGTPGLIIIEGCRAAVYEYVARLLSHLGVGKVSIMIG